MEYDNEIKNYLEKFSCKDHKFQKISSISLINNELEKNRLYCFKCFIAKNSSKQNNQSFLLFEDFIFTLKKNNKQYQDQQKNLNEEINKLYDNQLLDIRKILDDIFLYYQKSFTYSKEKLQKSIKNNSFLINLFKFSDKDANRHEDISKLFNFASKFFTEENETITEINSEIFMKKLFFESRKMIEAAKKYDFMYFEDVLNKIKKLKNELSDNINISSVDEVKIKN